jgi:cytochrome c-type biogenesis protein CcmH
MIPSSQSLSESMSMSDSIEKLQNFIEENPDDFQALKMLGLAQIGIGNVNESIKAFESAYLINSKDIDLLLQFSSAIAASQDGKFDGKSKVLIDEALSLDPQSIQVLYFSGIVSAHEGNLNGAIEFWEKALYLMSNDHPDRNIIEEALSTILNLQVK